MTLDVIVDGDKAYTPVAPSGATTITQGGTAQVLCVAGEVTRGGILKNPSTATELLLYTLDGTTPAATEGGSTFGLQAGESAVLPASTAAVLVRAATTGHVFSAWVH
jgi:hypothetical protein